MKLPIKQVTDSNTQEPFSFWLAWSRNLRIAYWLLLACLFTVIGFYITAYIMGSSWCLPVEVKTELQPNKHTLAEVNVGMFNIPIEGEIFVPAQKYQLASDSFIFPVWAYQLYGWILAFCAVLLLSVFTRLKSLWYAVGMTCFILFLSAMQLDMLLIFRGGSNLMLLITLLAYIAVTFGLQSFAKEWAWHWHFLSIAGFSALWWGYFLSVTPLIKPYIFLTTHGMMIPTLLTLVFITMTAQDIPHIIYHLIVKYNREGGKNNIVHISLMISLYFLHLFLYYFDTTNYLRLGLTFIDTHWLLLISTILGIWGYKKRETLISNILPFAPAGAFLYLAMAMISFSTIAFAQVTSQDPLLWVFRDFTLYAYIGFGLVFLMYIILNFNEPIRDCLEVHKITYEGKLVPFNYTRYFGFAITLMFYVAGQQYMYYQLLAGYYNGVGDAYSIYKERSLAKLNYLQAISNDHWNHHTNYALADIAGQEDNLPEKVAYLQRAFQREPLPETYLHLSQIFIEKEQPMHALFALQEGAKKFPKSTYLNNNLGLRYKESKVLDSAFYHLEKAKMYAKDEVAQNNFWAILAERKTSDTKLDKLPPVDREASNIIGRANKLTLFSRYGQQLTLLPLSTAGKVNMEKDLNQRLAYTYNYGLNRMGNTDEEVPRLLKELEKADQAGQHLDRTRFLNACYEYYRGNTNMGIQTLAGSPSIERDTYHNTILGLWLLEQKAYPLADYYLEKAIKLGNDREGKFYRAIVLSEMGKFAEAAEFWKDLANPTPREGKTEVSKEDAELAKWAVRILQVLSDESKVEDDNDRYNLIHYKRNMIPFEALQIIYTDMQDKHLKAKAACDLIDMLLAKGELAKALEIGLTLPNSEGLPANTASEMNFAKLCILAKQQKFEELASQIDKAKLNTLHKRSISFFKGQIAEDKNDLKTAEKEYLQATLRLPYNEDVTITVARFFQNKLQNAEKAYMVLVEAVRSNPTSIGLQQAYAQQCLIAGFENYGDNALAEIKKLASPADYEAYEKIYNKQKEQIRQAREGQNK